jgi:hypothetical protein
MTVKEKWIIENMDSKGFFLIYNYVGGRVGFSTDMDEYSRYDSLGMAEMLIERIKRDGYTFNLVPRKLKISYEIC